MDHIFSITSIIRNKLNEGSDVYVAYVDFRKAFDCVNCHGSMIHEVLFQAGNHSISCGISGRNQGSPLHNFYQGFPHFENEVPALSIVYLQ